MKNLLLMALMLCPQLLLASAAKIYITQDGSPTGNCTTNVQTPDFFNNAGNWGSGSSQIGPGTIVLICGTVTVPTNASGLTVHGSGTSSQPITIVFDTGTILQSNAFGGFNSPYGAAIVISGSNYITVDGQSTGIIQNLLNGSPNQTTCISGTCTIQQTSIGIYVNNTTGVEIKNLTVRNIYMDLNGEQAGGGSGAAWNTSDIFADGPNTGLKIDGNTLKDAHVGAWISFDHGSTSTDIFNNTIAHHGWQISAANGTSCSNTGTVNIYRNDISDYDDWNQGGASSFHTDGIIEYTRSTGCLAPTYNPVIYDNYFHGDLDGGTGSGTAHIYCSNDVGGSTSFPNSTCSVFNNVVDMSGSTNCAAGIWDAGQNAAFYNNTVIGPPSCTRGTSVGVSFGAGTEGIFQNNIFSTLKSIYTDLGPYGDVHSEISSSDFNDMYNCIGSSECFAFGQGNWQTLGAWQTSLGFDQNTITSNPQITSGYAPGTDSPVLGLGVNLDSLLHLTPCCATLSVSVANVGIQALAYDKMLTRRPVTGKWDLGAIQASPMPDPATSLHALAQ